jgi:hypothetical protein
MIRKVAGSLLEGKTLRLCTGRTTHGGSRGIALLFHDHGTRRRWGASVTPRPLFTPGKDPVPIVQEAGWAPGPVWTGAENLAPTGIRSPDRPGRSQSLYRLRYPAHHVQELLYLTLSYPMVITHKTCFNIQKPLIFSTDRIYGFHMVLMIITDNSPKLP